SGADGHPDWILTTARCFGCCGDYLNAVRAKKLRPELNYVIAVRGDEVSIARPLEDLPGFTWYSRHEAVEVRYREGDVCEQRTMTERFAEALNAKVLATLPEKNSEGIPSGSFDLGGTPERETVTCLQLEHMNDSELSWTVECGISGLKKPLRLQTEGSTSSLTGILRVLESKTDGWHDLLVVDPFVFERACDERASAPDSERCSYR
ncbi:MAG: hypothetical protein FJ096_19995, partial [Deltaproteobacteria bacterium]|nr:hypothetical protein [Deltaproteobacteria bacterium]